jgi:hypothetical protein
MDTEEVMKGLLDRLISHCRRVEGWNNFVSSVSSRNGELQDDYDLSDEQIGAMMFWRLHGLQVDEDGDTTNEFNEGVEDDDGMIVGFADWLVEFEEHSLNEFLAEGSFGFMADALLGIYHIGIEAGGKSHVITVNENEQDQAAMPPTLYPLSDAEVSEILRKRRGYGLRG